MNQRSVGTRFMTLTVLFAVSIFTMPISVAADGAPSTSGTLDGVVLQAGDLTPLPGVQVLIGSSANDRIAVSEPTGPDGSFRVTGLQPGSYDLAIRADRWMFVVEAPVSVDANETRTVDLLMDGNLLVEAASKVTEAATTGKTVSGHGGIWDNPLSAALIVIGGAVVVGVLVDELSSSDNNSSSTPASPF